MFLTIAGGIVLLALIIGLAVLGSYRAGKQQEAVRQKQQEETQKEEQEQIEAEGSIQGVTGPWSIKRKRRETIPRIKITERRPDLYALCQFLKMETAYRRTERRIDKKYDPRHGRLEQDH